MAFLGLTAGMLGNAVSSGVTGGMTGLISNGIGGLFGLIGAKKRQKQAEKFQREMMEKQHQYEVEKMGLQADYNKQQAEYTNELQKNMWDYTNYENQVKHLEAAGLNPGLLYGQSGGGGTSTGSASAAGVSQGESMAVTAGLQARSLMAEINKTEAEAKLANATANKTAGVDTIKTNAETQLTGSIMSLNETREALIKSEIPLNEETVKKINAEVENLEASLKGILADSEVKEETKKSRINAAAQEVINLGLQGALIGTQGALNEEERKLVIKRGEQIEQEMSGYWYELMTGRITANAMNQQAEAATMRVLNDAWYQGAKISIEERQLVAEYFRTAFQGLNAIANAIGQLEKFLPTKMMRTVFNRGWDRFEEIVTSKGK